MFQVENEVSILWRKGIQLTYLLNNVTSAAAVGHPYWGCK